MCDFLQKISDETFTENAEVERPKVEDLAWELDIEVELEFEKIKWEMLEFEKVDDF